MFLRKIVRIIAPAIAVVAFSVIPALADCAADEECWGASASGTWHDSDGTARVAIGAAWNYPSRRQAENGAMTQCNSRGFNCEVMGTFKNGGCGFITVGTNDNGVGAFTSDSVTNLYAYCSREGYICDPPIGGCTGER